MGALKMDNSFSIDTISQNKKLQLDFMLNGYSPNVIESIKKCFLGLAVISTITAKNIEIQDNNTNKQIETSTKLIIGDNNNPFIDDFLFDDAPLVIPTIKTMRVKINKIEPLEFEAVEDEKGFI